LKGSSASKEWYMERFPEFNRTCVACGASFNAVYLGCRRRVTCSAACSVEHSKALQRANTKRYIKGDKYKAYKAKYYENVRAQRRLGHKKPAVVYPSIDVITLEEVLEKIISKRSPSICTTMDGDSINLYRPKGLSSNMIMDQRFHGFTKRVLKKKVKNVRYMSRQKELTLPIMRIFRRRYGDLDECFEGDMVKTFDSLFPTLNQIQKCQSSPQLADLVVFHALKERGLYDPDKFQAASPLGNIPVNHRSWLC
jgi:hypothetical protein